VTALPFPPEGLQVGDLLLRAPAVADVPAIAPAFLDDAVGGEAGLPRLTAPEIEAFLDIELDGLRASGRLLPLVIVEGTAIVGGASLTNFDAFRDRVEIGYWLLAEGRGRGVATRVARALASHAFQAGVLRVEAVVRPDNTASIRVLERGGLLARGPHAVTAPHRNGRADAILFSLLSGE
jgi:[ribosomal protein S5]-alanine N-acetyltransferase